MKSRYVNLRKYPAGSPENKKITYPGKGTRFGKHLYITYPAVFFFFFFFFFFRKMSKIEYTLWGLHRGIIHVLQTQFSSLFRGFFFLPKFTAFFRF